MKVTGIVAEYNPFHNGHALQIEKIREMGAEYVVAVMSGNFVQRGEPALFDTETRVKAALESGVDLVLQLPVPFALSGASRFAHGGIDILAATGVVDSVAFGSECGDTELLCRTAELLSSPEVDSAIPVELSKGITYAKARENAVRAVDTDCADVLESPNDILAVEYISALKKSGKDITPTVIKRMGTGHDSEKISENIASASEIRSRIIAGKSWENFVPNRKIYENCRVFDTDAMNKFETAALYKMRTISREELLLCPDISEGIENRILTAARGASSLENLYSLAKTKRFTHSRIRRIVLSAVLGIKAEDTMKIPYIRVLGFTRERGGELMKKMNECAGIPVITKVADLKNPGPEADRFFSIESRATDIRNLCFEPTLPCDMEKKFTVIIK